MKIPEMEQEVERTFPVFKIIASESAVRNSQNAEQNTCHRLSMS